jgi:hypothetical protein
MLDVLRTNRVTETREVNMALAGDPSHIADQILTGDTARAGLLLVVLAAIISRWEARDTKIDQPVIQRRYVKHALRTFLAFIASLLSAVFALAFYHFQWSFLIGASELLFIVSLCVSGVSAYWNMRDAKLWGAGNARLWIRRKLV